MEIIDGRNRVVLARIIDYIKMDENDRMALFVI